MSNVNHGRTASKELGQLRRTPKQAGPHEFTKSDVRRSKELGRGISSIGESPAISAGGGIGGGIEGHAAPPGDFGQAIRNWVKDVTGRRLPSAQRAITFLVFMEVINHSPVASGAFMASWKFSEGSPDTSPIPVATMRAMNREGVPGALEAKIAELEGFIGGLTGNKNWSIFMTNTIPYARRVEYGGWPGTTAYAPIRKAMTALPKIIERALSGT